MILKRHRLLFCEQERGEQIDHDYGGDLAVAWFLHLSAFSHSISPWREAALVSPTPLIDGVGTPLLRVAFVDNNTHTLPHADVPYIPVASFFQYNKEKGKSQLDKEDNNSWS